MTKKIRLWDREEFNLEDGNLIVVPNEEVENMISLYDQTVWLFPELEITEENHTRLDSLLAKIEDFNDIEEVRECLQTAGFEPEMAGEWEEERHIMALDDNGSFDLFFGEFWPVWEYWDGSNWKKLFRDDTVSETVVEYTTENHDDLDTWDGSNWNYKGQFDHARVYKVLAVDDEPAEGIYLFYCWTQWQGDIPVGRLITGDEREELIKEVEEN